MAVFASVRPAARSTSASSGTSRSAESGGSGASRTGDSD